MMIRVEKDHIDDDRWNRMCRRVKRVEMFNLIVVVLVAFFYNKVTITWKNPTSSVDSTVSHPAPRLRAEDNVQLSAHLNPSIQEKQTRERLNEASNDVLTPEDIRRFKHIKETKETEDNLKTKTDNEIGKYVAEKLNTIKDHATTISKRNESPSKIASRNIHRDKQKHTQKNRIIKSSYHNDILDTGKNEALLQAPRDLQADDELSSCEGTLFHLQILLDFWPSETSWELAQTTSDNVIVSFNYTDEQALTVQAYTACLDDAQYFFIIYDEFADGIDCPLESCFVISLNDEVVSSDVAFSSGELTIPFDTSIECVVGALFEVEYSIATATDSSWTLRRVIHNKQNELIEMNQEMIMGNETLRFSTCVDPGTYLLEGQDVDADCDDCYKVFINSELIRQGKDFLGTDRHKFYVSPFGKGYEQHCDKLPQLTPTSFVNGFVFDETIERKLDAIYSLASMDTITNSPFSPQYQAACWIVFDDKVAYAKEMDESNNTITVTDEFMERYVLALFLFATKQDIEKLHAKACEFDSFRVACENNRITEIDYWRTDIRGFVPSELHHLMKLEFLDLGENNLHGTIPNQLSRLNQLQVLNLDGNEITGSIPPELGNLVSLEFLSLRQNKLTGTLPGRLGECSKLTRLFLDDNLLQGSIPPGIFRSHRLEKLNLAKNSMTGTIPSDIVKFQNLQEIILERNSLEGSIPSELWTLSSLVMIDFDKNQLTGSIQSEIGNLRQLEWFDADQNKLTGALPNVFTNMTELEYVDLSGNSFEGQIPDTLWQTKTERLFLTLNDVAGTVPDDFCGDEKVIQVDDSNWFTETPKVDCSCCDEGKCYMWDFDRNIEHIQCPIDNIVEFGYRIQYEVTDTVVNKTIVQGIGQTANGRTAQMCMSPTGCYHFDIILNEFGALDQNANFSAGYKIGAEKLSVFNDTDETDVCDVVNVCGEMIHKEHPKRPGLNHLTQLAAPDLTKLDEQDSATYKALCDVVTKDDMYDKYQICDGTLLQRYVLLYFYYSHGLDFDFIDLASDHTCEWPGVSCDSNDKFIKRLDLSSKNLQGNLITEIGLLKTLEEIDLSDNSFNGTIDPATYIELPDLKVVHLGTNKFGGTFPSEMLELKDIEKFNISGNLFVGSLPDVSYSQKLELFDISNNLFQGKFPINLLDSANLEIMDLSRNNFEDKIPTGIGNLKKLTLLSLSENSFDGSIPLEIFNADGIKNLTLQSNRLTGSIPTEIANLKGVQQILISHNRLKGFIPTQLEELEKLERLQLHRNQLHGIAPILLKPKKDMGESDYVTDCGDPNWHLQDDLTCKGCTMCCNSVKECQLADPTVITNTLLFLIVILIPVICALLFIFLVKKKRKYQIMNLFVDDRDPLSVYNDDSVYCFILSRNKGSYVIYFATVVIQIAIFSTYLMNSEFRDDSDWEYGYKCLGNAAECLKDRTDTWRGVFLFFIVTLVFLGNDLSMSILQIRKSVYIMDKQLCLSGFVLFFLTAYALLVSLRYNTALADKNTSWITNAMILLFVNELDEKVLNILIALAPDWTEKVLEQVNQNMLTKRPHHIPMHIPVVGAARRNMKNANLNMYQNNTSTSPNSNGTRFPNAKGLAGFVRASSRRLMKKTKQNSKQESRKWHEGELDYPDSVQSDSVDEEYPRQRNWHTEEVDCPQSDESGTNEVSYEDSSQNDTERIEYLESNQDSTNVGDEVDPNSRHIADFDFHGPHQEENADSANVNEDQTHEDIQHHDGQDKTNEIDLLEMNTGDANEVVNLDDEQEQDDVVDHLDSVEGGTTEAVSLEVVQSHESTVDHLDTNQSDAAEPVFLEVVQSHENIAGTQDTSQGDMNEAVFLEVVESHDNLASDTQETAQGDTNEPVLQDLLQSQLHVVDSTEVSNTVRSSQGDDDNLNQN